jgi:alpha-beta hydrolase superfamily lysophospholipase
MLSKTRFYIFAASPLALFLTQCVSSPTSLQVSPPASHFTANLFVQQDSSCDPNGTQASGAIYRLCVPGDWVAGDSDLVVYVPGYKDPLRPIEIPEEQVDGLPEIFNDLGIAFATTSFTSNGLISGQEGIPDLLDLVQIFKQTYGNPRQVYIFSVSLGSIIASQLLETSSAEYDGGLLGCGPLGDFQAELNHLADVRVLFDYFFPSVLPGNLTSTPATVRVNWETVYVPAIAQAITTDPQRTREFLNVANLKELESLEATAADLVNPLFFSVFATEDAINRMGGLPYDNRDRRYSGSRNDFKLNQEVDRFAGDANAFTTAAELYQASGEFSVPVVTLHSVVDYVVPYEQEIVYRRQVRSAGNSRLHRNFLSFTAGHCNLSLPSFVAAFSSLVRQVNRRPLANPERVLTDPGDLKEYYRLLEIYDTQH